MKLIILQIGTTNQLTSIVLGFFPLRQKQHFDQSTAVYFSFVNYIHIKSWFIGTNIDDVLSTLWNEPFNTYGNITVPGLKRVEMLYRVKQRSSCISYLNRHSCNQFF